MSPIESQLLETLLELERTAALAKTSQSKPGILPLLEKVDELASMLPPGTPGELRHFLQRKSYEKARLFLQGRQEENAPGACGH